MGRDLRRFGYPLVTPAATVYLAAAIEYLTAEILELAGNESRTSSTHRRYGAEIIQPRDILRAINADPELQLLVRRCQSFPEPALYGYVVPAAATTTTAGSEPESIVIRESFETGEAAREAERRSERNRINREKQSLKYHLQDYKRKVAEVKAKAEADAEAAKTDSKAAKAKNSNSKSAKPKTDTKSTAKTKAKTDENQTIPTAPNKELEAESKRLAARMKKLTAEEKELDEAVSEAAKTLKARRKEFAEQNQKIRAMSDPMSSPMCVYGWSAADWDEFAPQCKWPTTKPAIDKAKAEWSNETKRIQSRSAQLASLKATEGIAEPVSNRCVPDLRQGGIDGSGSGSGGGGSEAGMNLCLLILNNFDEMKTKALTASEAESKQIAVELQAKAAKQEAEKEATAAKPAAAAEQKKNTKKPKSAKSSATATAAVAPTTSATDAKAASAGGDTKSTANGKAVSSSPVSDELISLWDEESPLFRYPIHAACALGDLDTLKKVVGGDPNSKDFAADFDRLFKVRVSFTATATATAATAGTRGIESSAANICFVCCSLNVQINSYDIDGLTPLCVAVMHGRFDCVKFLLSAGAEFGKTFDAVVDRSDEKHPEHGLEIPEWTAMDEALRIDNSGHFPIVDALIAAGDRVPQTVPFMVRRPMIERYLLTCCYPVRDLAVLTAQFLIGDEEEGVLSYDWNILDPKTASGGSGGGGHNRRYTLLRYQRYWDEAAATRPGGRSSLMKERRDPVMDDSQNDEPDSEGEGGEGGGDDEDGEFDSRIHRLMESDSNYFADGDDSAMFGDDNNDMSPPDSWAGYYSENCDNEFDSEEEYEDGVLYGQRRVNYYAVAKTKNNRTGGSGSGSDSDGGDGDGGGGGGRGDESDEDPITSSAGLDPLLDVGQNNASVTETVAAAAKAIPDKPFEFSGEFTFKFDG